MEWAWALPGEVRESRDEGEGTYSYICCPYSWGRLPPTFSKRGREKGGGGLSSVYHPHICSSEFLLYGSRTLCLYRDGRIDAWGLFQLFREVFIRDASSPIFFLIQSAGAHGVSGGRPKSTEGSTRRQREVDAKKRRSVDSSAGAGGGGIGGGGNLLDEELHVYIAAMQLFPIKLNFSFIKNADVKVM